MLIAVVSDTHDLMNLANRVMDVCRERGVQRILHCGDICTANMIDLFKDIPTEYVFGNCDGAKRALTERMAAAGAILHERFGSVLWDGKKIAFLHGDNDTVLDRECRSGKWDMVCFGHTHIHNLFRTGNTLVLNPGAIQPRCEPSRFCLVRLPELEIIPIPIE